MTAKNIVIGYEKVSRRLTLSNFEKYVGACELMVSKSLTLRAAASECGISKSTLHKFITTSLVELKNTFGYKTLYKKARSVLNANRDARAHRGGQATKSLCAMAKKCAIVTEEFEAVDMFGQTCLFTNGRISRTMLNDLGVGLHAYDLRMNDSHSRFATLEHSVCVNHGGTIISKKPILEDDYEYTNLTDDTAPNFLGKNMTLAQFVRSKG